ncbi:MAG: phytanoyl-CoA dioxygenase family protein [Candidatus Latescibacterota bacterium]|nr:phytanoyl-CoA dioxygenase family protein [Candidatus Latescibacterota bacterium]
MRVSKREIHDQRLRDESLSDALCQVRESGYVILEQTMSMDWVETMRKAWDPHIEGEPADLLSMPFLDPLAIENPWAMQILDVMLGADFWAKLPYHCNSTAPNWPDTQVIHRDQAHLFPELPMPLPPHMFVVNIPLVDFIDDNGSTELWPGTHLVTDHEESYRPEDGGQTGRLEKRAASMHSVRTNMPAGSTVVRDMRVWHRAVPNRTAQRRTMLSLVYHRFFPTLGYQFKAAEPLPTRVTDGLSERARRIFRFNKEEAHV